MEEQRISLMLLIIGCLLVIIYIAFWKGVLLVALICLLGFIKLVYNWSRRHR